MLRELRLQVTCALNETPASRKPALRRSDSPDALLATDLPLVADKAAVEAFAARLTAQGWRVFPGSNNWLLLDAEVPVPQVVGDFHPQGEAACCISILQRHLGNGDARERIRALVKAAEAGRQPLERLCAALHGDLAAMLRRHERLPGGLLPYLYRAVQDVSDRRNKG